MKYLILGASSYIGGYIYDRMKENDIDVIGTQCHITSDKEYLSFNILKDKIDQILCDMSILPDAAVICIAQTNFDQCADDYDTAYAINVSYMKKLIDRLNAWKIKVIYISSDNVFDGKKGNYTEQDKTNAIGKYGMMKEEMEKYILEYIPNACILRIAKPVCERRAKRNLLTEWVNKRKEKAVIFCIKDNYMSFLAMEDVFKVCMLAVNKDLKGLYNIAGDNVYSRKELAVKFFNCLGDACLQIEERDLQEFGFKDIRPLNTSMSNQKLKTEMNYHFIPIEEVIRAYVEGMNGTEGSASRRG